MLKVIGNTTATPNPRPDWAQTDPAKADYIKNKPDVAGAIKGFAAGSVLSLTDVSPIEHTMGVKLTHINNVSLLPYTITDQAYIGGIPYEIKDDGTIHISGICDVSKLNGNFVVIKELLLSEGYYTISANFPKEDWKIEINGLEEFITISQGCEKRTFYVDETTNISIAIIPTVLPNAKYDFELKPILFRGTEIIDMSGTEVIVCDENHSNETTYHTDESGYVSVKSIFPTTIIQTSEDGWVFEVEYNRDVNKALNEHSETLRDHSNAIKQTNQMFANALKGKASGSTIYLTDVSPVEHTMSVKAISDNILLYPYTIAQDHIFGLSYEIEDDGTIHIYGECDGNKDYVSPLIIKEILLNTGEYTLSVTQSGNFNGAYISVGVSTDEGGYNAVSEDYTTTFWDSGTDYRHLALLPTGVQPGETYDFRIKPLMSNGNKVAPEVSNTEVIQFGENLFDQNVSDIKFSKYVNANGEQYRYGITLELPEGEYVATFKILNKSIYKQGIFVYGLVKNKYTHEVVKDSKGNTKTLHLWTGVEARTPLFTVGKDEVVLIYDGQPTDSTGEHATELLSPENCYIHVNQNTKGVTGYYNAEQALNTIKHTVSTDGTVEGVTALHPRTYVYTDTAGVSLDVGYNKDINKTFKDVETQQDQINDTLKKQNEKFATKEYVDQNVENINNTIDNLALPPKGDNCYVRYSAHADGTDFTEAWSSDKHYIGFATGQEAPNSKEGYMWAEFVGKDGVTPHIGANGNWYVGDTDTGVVAAALAEGATVVQAIGDSEIAVMSQNAVREVLDVEPQPAYVRGSLSSSDGSENNTLTTRIRSDYVKSDNIVAINISSADYAIYVYAYDTNKNFLFNSGGWVAEFNVEDFYNLNPNVGYLRLVLKHQTDKTLSTDVDIPASGLFIQYKAIKDVKQRVSNIEEAMCFKQPVYENGGVDSNNGSETSSQARIRSGYIECDAAASVNVSNTDAGYSFTIYAYDDNKIYLGSLGKWMTSCDINNVYVSYPSAAYFRIIMRRLYNNYDQIITTDKDVISSGIYVSMHNVIHTHNSRIEDLAAKQKTALFDYESCELPVLYLNGDTSKMSKEKEVTLDYTYIMKARENEKINSSTRTGTCTCKWQGSSSVRLNYPKRNYTIKFDNAFEAKSGWGSQKKYCMKANWIDPSALRNVVSARLWGQVVASRNLPDTDGRATAPNYGAVDGFPIIIVINGEFMGLYTHNIPKDGWMFGMSDGETEYLIGAENNGRTSCEFQAEATFDGTDPDTPGAAPTLDYSVEYVKYDSKVKGAKETAETSAQEAFKALTRKVAKMPNEDDDWKDNIWEDANWEEELKDDLDIDSVIDYFIFINCIAGIDNLAKNILYGTYDGTKWFMSAYDLDSTYGSSAYGEKWYPIPNEKNTFAKSRACHRLMALIYDYSKSKLKERYIELRSGVLSEANVWYELTNFATSIPKGVYNMDSNRWSTMPATSTANIDTYMNYYRMQCAVLDKEIEALA